jgi:tRNA (guanine26-N2/guanine27-N2)-dimethyltransferase
VKSIKRNSAFNQVPEGLIDTRQSDAKFLMYKMLDDAKGDRNKPETAVHFIDVDPYGGANEFLDGAVQLVADGGMLGITCTDLAVLCGNYAESCFAKYGSMPPKRGEYCHEMALRIVLAFTAITAARYKRVIEPLVVCYADFYVRLFVRVRSSPGGVKETASKLAHIYQCNRCPSFYIQRTGKFLKNGRSEKFNPGFGPPVGPRCPHCEGSHQFAGPFWAEPIFNQDWLDRGLAHIKDLTANGTIGQVYGTHKRILGTLFSCKDELADVPLFFFADRVANVLRTTVPRMDAIRSAIHRMGFRVSQSHTEPGALKTDAPFEVILDIFKVWHLQTKDKTGAGATSVKPGSPAEFLWKTPITHIPEEKRAGLFEIIPEACTPKKDENGDRLARYLLNPTANWGPGSRAGRKRDVESMQDALAIKRAENQGKRSKRRKTVDAATGTSSSVQVGASSTGADHVSGVSMLSASSFLQFFRFKSQPLSPFRRLPRLSACSHRDGWSKFPQSETFFTGTFGSGSKLRPRRQPPTLSQCRSKQPRAILKSLLAFRRL